MALSVPLRSPEMHPMAPASSSPRLTHHWARRSRIRCRRPEDLEPVLLVGTAPYVIANPSRPYKPSPTSRRRRANAWSHHYSRSRSCTLGHLATLLLAKRPGIERRTYPAGAALAIVDAVAGHVDLIWVSVPSCFRSSKAASCRGLMQTGVPAPPR